MGLAVNADNQAAIVAQGGLAALLAAQRNHAGHADVSHYFCRALATIAISQRAAVEACGGVALVRKIMQQFSANAAIQEQGKRLLN